MISTGINWYMALSLAVVGFALAVVSMMYGCRLADFYTDWKKGDFPWLVGYTVAYGLCWMGAEFHLQGIPV